ncbi:MAG: hypothetical protein IPK82_35635 [Polyangiaceae bacterium]|nr:hypothetical protein [Polyangiaceae bacterium]
MNQPRRRVLVATKILTVALTAATGCTTVNSASGTLSETSVPTVEIGHSDVAPAAVSTAAVALVESPVEPAPPVDSAQAVAVPVPSPQPPEPEQNSPLALLRDELVSLGRIEKALLKKEHFRPLCDKDGYPLVGNVVTGKGPQVMPSQFCSVLRTGSPRAPGT